MSWPNQEPADTANPLTNREWVLEHYGPSDQPIAPVAQTTITAAFQADGKLGGSSGCNSYFAAYTIDGQRLTIDQPGRTEMACAEPVMRQENAFLEALIMVESFKVDGDTLTITYQGGQLRFNALQRPADLPLLHTTWQLTTFVQGDTAASTIGARQITMQLANGIVRGTSGCNQYSAIYTVNGQMITVSQINQTKMACPDPGVMQQEAQYLTTLQATTAWNIEGQQLVLSQPDGALHFTALSPAPEATTSNTN